MVRCRKESDVTYRLNNKIRKSLAFVCLAMETFVCNCEEGA